jgi:CheY-like chemotaxis protein
MEQNNFEILCIEDDKDTCELVTFVFEQEGYKVESCSQMNCLELVHDEKFKAIILDNYFIETSGINICQEIRKFNKIKPIIFFSGEVRQQEIEKAIAAGANVYLTKPMDFEKLLPTTVKLINESEPNFSNFQTLK